MLYKKNSNYVYFFSLKIKCLYVFCDIKFELEFLFNKLKRLKKKVNKRIIKIIARPIVIFVAQSKVVNVVKNFK